MYTGPTPPWNILQDQTKYTWMKAPRYEGKPMQVGPLARMLVAYGSGHAEVKEMVGDALGKLEVGPEALFSTLGRTAARGIETVLLARRMEVWFGQLIERIKSGDTRTFDEREMGAVHLAGARRRVRLPRCAARSTGPLGPDRGRQDLPLPVRGPQHLELLSPRRSRGRWGRMRPR